jgi:hypothetical protein
VLAGTCSLTACAHILNRVEYIKWISLATCITRYYFRENILKKHVFKDSRLKNDSKFSCMFQHDQARAHMETATTELLEEYNINFIEWT